MRNRSFILSLLPFFLAIGLGSVLSTLYSQGRFVSWMNMGNPTDKSLRFNAVRYDQNNLYTPLVITTDSDGTHHIGSVKDCVESGHCWSQRENSSIIESWGGADVAERCQINRNLRVTEPPNSVSCISSSDVASGSQLVLYAYFVQTADGNIHAWNFVPAHGALIIFVVSVFLGLMVTGFIWMRAE